MSQWIRYLLIKLGNLSYKKSSMVVCSCGMLSSKDRRIPGSSRPANLLHAEINSKKTLSNMVEVRVTPKVGF